MNISQFLFYTILSITLIVAKAPPAAATKPATDGQPPATDGKQPATDGKQPATDGKTPATDGKPNPDKSDAAGGAGGAGGGEDSKQLKQHFGEITGNIGGEIFFYDSKSKKIVDKPKEADSAIFVLIKAGPGLSKALLGAVTDPAVAKDVKSRGGAAGGDDKGKKPEGGDAAKGDDKGKKPEGGAAAGGKSAPPAGTGTPAK